MGIVLSRVFQALFGSKEVRILILGLDNAGKTTILYRLQNEADDNIQTIPTIGFNVETLQYKNIKFQVCCSIACMVVFEPEPVREPSRLCVDGDDRLDSRGPLVSSGTKRIRPGFS